MLRHLTSKFSRILGEAGSIAIALSVALVVRTAVAEQFSIPSSSMEPTLLVGDHPIAGKYTYGYSKFSSPIGLMPDFKGRILQSDPERGDVIVFRLPSDPSIHYVKRLIGLPGDRIKLTGGRLYINGALVPRRDDGFYMANIGDQPMRVHRYIETLPGGHAHETLEISDSGRYDTTMEFKVPQGAYFMMGDNRDNSLDSRESVENGGVGFVPLENLIGRVDRILYSYDPEARWWDVADLFRGERFLAAVE
jgi:signal peptidase I